MRGRRPKPVEQHRAEGTRNVTRHSAVPVLVGGRRKPPCPKHLTGKARTAYRILVTDLWGSKYLDAADRLLIATAAMLYATAMSAQEVVDKLGPVYPVTRGARSGLPGYTVIEANPAVALRKGVLAEFRLCCELLGVGPAARAHLQALGPIRSRNAPELPAVVKFRALRDAAANRGRSANESAPKPVAPADNRRKPACPKELQGDARAAWRMIMNDLWDSGILEHVDRTALATAAMHYGAAMSALATIEKHGIIYPVTRGARDGAPGYRVIEANPATRILRDSLAEFRHCCDLLGIGPAARARLSHLGVKGRDILLEIAGVAEMRLLGPVKRAV